jgi:hypothetical protein
MYTVYNCRSIVKLNFRGDPVHKRKGLFAAHDHELTNNFNEMEGKNGLQSCLPGKMRISSNPFMPLGFARGESINSVLRL